MSKLFKSKFLLGVMIVVFVLALSIVWGDTASAATCSITKTLRVGSKGAEVQCLQSTLGLTADGSFGPKTKAGVVAWQQAAGLVADGVFGAKSRAVFNAGGAVSGNFPAGCTSASGFSTTTGLACNSVNANTFPAGCTSASGFSATTGLSCSGAAVTPPGQTGPVTVALSADNPAAGYIIGGQALADLAHFTFSGSGTVTSVMLKRAGISDQDTLSNVYLFDGNTRLTDGYSFNNTGVMTMNGLNIAVNGSKVISVKADVAVVTNASTLGVNLTSFTAGGAASAVMVKGNEMTYGTGNLSTVYLNTNTSSSVRSVNAGTSAYTVWSAPVQVNTRAIQLKGANFRMTGSAPVDALQNIKLYVDGVVVGSAATMGVIGGTNYAMFDFSAAPVALSTGSHTVELRADVVKGASYKVTVSIQQASDLAYYDPQVGVNIASLGNAGGAFTANASGEITINPGSSSVTVDPTFQALTNVTGGATNAVIGKFKVHGYGEDVKVSSLDVKVLMKNATAGTCTTDGNGLLSAGTCGMNNVTVYFNGSQVGSSKTLPSAAMTTALNFPLGSQLILPAGTDSYIEIRADMQTAGSVNYTAGLVTATLMGLTGNSQGQSSQSTLSFPGTTGNNVATSGLTVQTGVLAVAKSSFANTNSNPNAQNVKIGSFNLQNQSSSESVRVTSLAVTLVDSTGATLTASTTPALSNFSNLKTSETSGSGSTPVQPSGADTFSVDFTIAPGATKMIDVFADTGAAVGSVTVRAKLVATALGTSSNVAVSQNGNGTAVVGQTITLVAGTVAAPTLVSSNSTTGQFVAAATGATSATKATFNVGATNGTATISKLKFVVRGTATVSGLNTVDSVSVGSVSAPVVMGVTNSTVLADAGGPGVAGTVGDTFTVASATGIVAGSVVTVESEDMLVASVAGNDVTVAAGGRGYNGTTAVAHADLLAVLVKNGVAYLPGLALAVPNGGSGLNLDAYVTYSAVGTNGTASMSASNISLSYMEYNAGGTTSTRCVNSSAITCTTNTAEVAAPTMATVGSKPTLTVTGSSDTLGNANVKVMEVTVAADAKGDVKLVALPVKISTTPASGGVTWDGSANAVTVKDTSGSVVTTTSAGVGGAVGACTGAEGVKTGVCTAVITFGTGYLIPAGTSKTFRIYVTAASVSGAVNTMSLSSTLGASTGLSWLDVAGANAVAITGSDNTSYFYNYPTDTSVIKN